MKRNIFLIGGIIILLFGVLIGGGYLLLNKGDKGKVNEPVKEEEPEETDEEKKEKELLEYLSYVPYDFSLSTDYEYNTLTSAYDLEYANVSTINKMALLGHTLTKIMEDKNVGAKKYFFKSEDIKSYLLKMYDINYDDYKLDSSSNALVTSRGVELFYNDKVFNTDGKDVNPSLNRFISNYVYNNNTLTIYEYVSDTQSVEYIKHHQVELTRYKHTFKKNDSGYYWYSTEKENKERTFISTGSDNKDNRGLGASIALTPELRSKTLNLIPYFCGSNDYNERYIYNNYYPSVRTKFDNAVKLLVDTEGNGSCNVSNPNGCYFSLDRIKPYYIKLFGSANYDKDAAYLKNTSDASYKDNSYLYKLNCTNYPATNRFIEEVGEVVNLNDRIEIYVRGAFVNTIKTPTGSKVRYYKDFQYNDFILEVDNSSIVVDKSNFAVYKYVLLKENDNYYFDHIERIR